MKRGTLIALVVLAAGTVAAGWYAVETGRMRNPLQGLVVEPAGMTNVAPTPQPQISTRIIADALVVPRQNASLSLPVPGLVAEVFVREGDHVDAGELLVRLKSDREVLAVAQTQADVDRARAQVELLSSGARSEELLAAQAAVDAAQAQVEILQQGPRDEDIAAAEAALAAAQAQYQTVATGVNQQDVIAARVEMQNAEAIVTQAQRAYDKVAWQADVGTLPEAAALQTATNEYQAAQARYEATTAGVQPSLLAEAAALIDQARAQMERLQAPPTTHEIAAAEAAVRQAQAAYDLLAAGTRPQEVAMAQGELAAAETLLMQAQLALSERELHAPFAGVVARMELTPGQEVDAGEIILDLADQSQWFARTTDLSEISVVEVQVGDGAVIRVDAIPDVDLPGHVVGISPFGTNILGDITYTVTVQLDDSDPRLRWNMTAAVEIERE